MAGNRRQAREAALGYLYQWDAQVSSQTESPAQFIKHFKVAEPFQDYFLSLVEGSIEHKGKIDEEVEKVSDNWKLYRMARVDRSILRLSTWELLFCEGTSHQIIIDEAIELAKTYGSEKSASFINGILDKIAQKHRSS
jgi:N utilization substance protein B